MYNNYWGFSERPFENAPNPRFMYYSKQHLEALTRLLYTVIEKKSAAILIGEYGSGKTIISRIVTRRLLQEEDKYNVALIVNPPVSPIQMLKEILYQLGGEAGKSRQKIDILHVLNDRLYKNMNENRHTVVIIDEAQTIYKKRVFEEIRLLLNFQSDEGFLLTLLLLGQPELKQKVNEIPQLEQRFSVRYYLRHLPLEETAKYIEHRCQAAGRKERIFTDSACRAIYEASEGIPRKINNICDICLIIGCDRTLDKIDENIVRAVATDLNEYAQTNAILNKPAGYKKGQPQWSE